jgi:hypothetical protein
MDRSRLAVGDAVVVTGVVLAGDLTHGTNPVTAPLSAAETLVPFLAGWLLVAALVGVYDADGPWRATRLVAAAWLGGANLGLIARGSPALSGGTTWPFPLVITGSVLGALVLWRGVTVAVGRVRTPDPTRSAGD